VAEIRNDVMRKSATVAMRKSASLMSPVDAEIRIM
jgi:hypothetical protein